MREGIRMKNYVNVKAEIYKLDAGDIMLASVNSLDLKTWTPDDATNSSYSKWEKWT